MFTRPFHTSYRPASQRSWQRMNQFRRRRSQCLVIGRLRSRVQNRLFSQFGWCCNALNRGDLLLNGERKTFRGVYKRV